MREPSSRVKSRDSVRMTAAVGLAVLMLSLGGSSAHAVQGQVQVSRVERAVDDPEAVGYDAPAREAGEHGDRRVLGAGHGHPAGVGADVGHALERRSATRSTGSDGSNEVTVAAAAPPISWPGYRWRARCRRR